MINIEITEENIISIPFDEYFSENVKLTKNEVEFYGNCGKEHYRLLSYISSLFNYCNIIDLGTHRGMSALALSYNETNRIYSFDIVDNVTEQVIKDKSNIKFIHDNLWESDIQEKWKELILKSEFIFLDVEPTQWSNGNRFL